MQYPIHLHVKTYKGNSQKRKIKWQEEVGIASRISDYLNTKLSPLKDKATVTLNYYEIARDLNIEKTVIRQILFANGGGANGITLRK